MAKLEFKDEELILEIVDCAMKVFCNGIYVPCNEHPCGWDFISFEYMEYDEALTYKFENIDISNGTYSYHPYEEKTLLEILKLTEGRYAFELSNIDW